MNKLLIRNHSSPNTRTKFKAGGGDESSPENNITARRSSSSTKRFQGGEETERESELNRQNNKIVMGDYAFIMLEDKGSMFDTLEGGCKYQQKMGTDPLMMIQK